MEPELATRDAELQLLRSKVDALEIKAEYHKASYERIDNKLVSPDLLSRHTTYITYNNSAGVALHRY